jgi:hypothetical protein
LHGNGGDGQIDDVASINQTGTGIRLPNFCNLGVMLRSLLIANLFVAAAASRMFTATIARSITPRLQKLGNRMALPD